MSTQSSNTTNLSGPNLTATSAVQGAQKYYNNLYATSFATSANTNDALVAFFEEYCPTKVAADNLASAVMATALAQNTDPLTILAQFQALPKGQLNNYLIAFLNISRVPTSMLGTNAGAKTNSFVSRSILL
jgi:hypothetical protein